MPTKTITLSIPTEMYAFLEENPELSPSKLLQSKINEIQEQRRFILDEKHFKVIKELHHQIEIRNNFIENHKLFPEFLQQALSK